MNLNLKNKKVLGFGKIILRITTSNNQKIVQANSFEAIYSVEEAKAF